MTEKKKLSYKWTWRKKMDLIDDFGRDEDHVDETGDELPE
jgi:hypothetical protein